MAESFSPKARTTDSCAIRPSATTARKFFITYADRILFGTDMPADVATYQLYYRFLESDDEYFPYHLGAVPPQGRWHIYGLYLPDDVLKKIYHVNAQKVMRLPA